MSNKLMVIVVYPASRRKLKAKHIDFKQNIMHNTPRRVHLESVSGRREIP